MDDKCDPSLELAPAGAHQEVSQRKGAESYQIGQHIHLLCYTDCFVPARQPPPEGWYGWGHDTREAVVTALPVAPRKEVVAEAGDGESTSGHLHVSSVLEGGWNREKLQTGHGAVTTGP